jgi:hypothetical protein
LKFYDDEMWEPEFVSVGFFYEGAPSYV